MIKSLRTVSTLLLLWLLAAHVRAATVAVTVNDDFFSPKDTTVNVGDTVTWVWRGNAQHDTVSYDGLWKSPLQGRNSTYSFTFNTPGLFKYYCTPHENVGMVGSITVQGGAVNQPPTVSLTAPTGGATFLTTDTITFSANASDDVSVAKVEFFDGSNLIGTATTAPYTVTGSLAAGTHSITAKATDGAGLSTTSTAVSITVNAPNQAPTVSLTAPSDAATFLTTDTITFSANASDDVSVAKVEFFSDGNLIGTDTTAPYSITASLPAGTHSITARATDGAGLSTTSTAVSITVNAPNQAPTVSLTAPSDAATFLTTDTITFSANASDDVSVAKVEFFSDGNLIGTDTTAPYSITASLPAGTHSITAKATDGAGLSTTSTSVSITVNGPNSPPTVSLSSAQAGTVLIAPATVTLSAIATDDGAVTQVEFFKDGVSLSVDTTAPYEATLSNLGAGVYSFTAVAKDNTGATTTSAAVEIRVAAEVHITSITQSGSFTITASATTGISYDLEATTDFATWTTVASATAANGTVTLTDPASLPMRYYRVVAR